MTNYAGLDLLVPMGDVGGVSTMGVSGSPCRSPAIDGERPELELDMWEGQFSLCSDNVHWLEDSEAAEDSHTGGFVNDIINSTDRWKKDSSVTCTTVQQLQEKVEALTELHSPSDDKYMRLKQENVALYRRLEALEQHIKERDRRENQVTSPFSDKNECDLLKEQIEKIKAEKAAAEEQLLEAQYLVVRTQEAYRALQETYRSVQEEFDLELQQSKTVIEDLNKQLENYKNVPMENGICETDEENVPKDASKELPERILDMEGEILKIRHCTLLLKHVLEKGLNNKNEELEAKIGNKGVDEGIRIIIKTNIKSVAEELDAMSENEKSVCFSEELQKVRKALEDQQEVNDQLRGYIDTVLLNIMEKYPDLLEVRAVK